MNNASAETRQQRRHSARQERKQGLSAPLQKNAFYRAYAAFKLRAEAMQAAMVMGPIAAKLALMDLAFELGKYTSRGKGGKRPRHPSRRFVAQDRRAARKARRAR